MGWLGKWTFLWGHGREAPLLGWLDAADVDSENLSGGILLRCGCGVRDVSCNRVMYLPNSIAHNPVPRSRIRMYYDRLYVMPSLYQSRYQEHSVGWTWVLSGASRPSSARTWHVVYL